MPYAGMPDDPETLGKMDACVQQVMAQGHDKASAIAICRASLGKEHKALRDELRQANGLTPERLASFLVLKQADGRYRWVAFSSTAFKDRDGEIVSTQALADDVARADALKEYGPLRWWHVPGLDFGTCDYNALAGRVLVESGTFNSDGLGERIKEAADGLALSIGFLHPPDEPDAGGVFHTIRRFERSLLPAGKASNLFTRLVVKEQDAMSMFKDKLDELKKLIGVKEAEALVAQAEATEKAADAAGVAFKETEAQAQAEKAAGAPPQAAAVPAQGAVPPHAAPAAAAPAQAAPAGQEPDADDNAKPMTKGEVADFVAKCMEPVTKAIEMLQGRKEADEASLKEARDASALLGEAIKTMVATQQKIAADVAELKGETPRSARGFNASHDPSTITQKEELRALGAGQENVAPDGLTAFLQFAVNGKAPGK